MSMLLSYHTLFNVQSDTKINYCNLSFFNLAENEKEICQRKVTYKRTLGLLLAT